jgi:surfeit locus 1 family protein
LEEDGLVELTRSGIVGTVVVLLVVAGCIRLGLWQLDRRDQKLAHNAAVAERLAVEPVTLHAPPTDSSGLVHRSATVRGRYDHDRSFVLMGRSHGGAPGVYVFTPLRLEEGAILVNRGWVHAPDAATVDLAAISRPWEATVSGVLLAFPDVRDPGADGSFRQRWSRLDGQAIRAQYPYPVAPLYLLDTAGAGASGAGDPGSSGDAESARAPVPLDPPVLDAGPHLSYAVQWFSFATIFLVGWTVLVVRRAGRDPGPRSATG